jgi:hypothetical protein
VDIPRPNYFVPRNNAQVSVATRPLERLRAVWFRDREARVHDRGRQTTELNGYSAVPGDRTIEPWMRFAGRPFYTLMSSAFVIPRALLE